jgi:hypothetical protein
MSAPLHGSHYIHNCRMSPSSRQLLGGRRQFTEVLFGQRGIGWSNLPCLLLSCSLRVVYIHANKRHDDYHSDDHRSDDGELPCSARGRRWLTCWH